MERMGPEMTVEDLGEVKFDQEAQQQWHIIDAFVGQFEGSVHGRSPTKSWGKTSLYRGGHGEGKIQVTRSEHGNDRKVRIRHDELLTVHLIRER